MSDFLLGKIFLDKKFNFTAIGETSKLGRLQKCNIGLTNTF